MFWLTRDRLTIYPWIIFIGYLITMIVLHVMAFNQAANGLMPMETDFNTFYAVSNLLDQRSAADAYDGAILHGYERAAMGQAFGGSLTPLQIESVRLFPWNYPPVFLLIMPLFNAVPYVWSLFLWGGLTFIPFVIAARLVVPDKVSTGLALAHPSIFINAMFGQNGFLTGGLFGLGLIALHRRPVLAGILIGLLCYKPQFGIFIPLALAAGGHWRAFMAAAVTVGLLVLASFFAFGPEPWAAFFSRAEVMRSMMESGGTEWTLMPTAFVASRMVGISVAVAYGVQAFLTIAVAVVVIKAWRIPSDGAEVRYLQSALLIIGSFLGTPFAYSYDMPVLALALLWLGFDMHRHGWRPWEGWTVAAAIALPIAAPWLAKVAAVQAGPLILGALFMCAIGRLRQTVDRPA